MENYEKLAIYLEQEPIEIINESNLDIDIESVKTEDVKVINVE